MPRLHLREGAPPRPGAGADALVRRFLSAVDRGGQGAGDAGSHEPRPADHHHTEYGRRGFGLRSRANQEGRNLKASSLCLENIKWKKSNARISTSDRHWYIVL